MTLSRHREAMMRLRSNGYLERARSLSPIKGSSSNTGTPNSTRSTMDTSMQEGLSDPPSIPIVDTRDHGIDDDSHTPNGGPLKSDVRGTRKPPYQNPQASALSNTSPGAAMPLSRSGTLSWQQRPTSRGSTTGVRSRPLSMVATHNSAARSPRTSPDPASTSETAISRAQVAQSLGSKDPTWFKQTEDRGLGSAGYRRNQEEDILDTAYTTRSVRLPGLSRETSVEPEKERSPPPESVRSSSPSRDGSTQGTSGWSHLFSSSAAVSSTSGIRSPLPTLSSQRFDPPSSDSTSSHDGDVSTAGRTLAMSPSQGKISPERFDRPTSPTKGLGGFVQSAMLKRSDSVNKRWSAQPGAGLSRGNSIASNRSGYDGSRPTMGMTSPHKEPRLGNISSDNSPSSKSRPVSSHSNINVTQQQSESETPGTSSSLTSSRFEIPSHDGFTKPTLPHQRSITPVTAAREHDQETTSLEKSPPVSPSKRWSPMKASWLENAINKPDSPRTKAPPPQQPSWMAEINRAKQQRGNVDLGKVETHKEVATGGLIRSPPLSGSGKPHTIRGLPIGTSAGLPKKPKTESLDSQASNGSANKDIKSNELIQNSPAPFQSSKTPMLVMDPPESGGSTTEAKGSIEPSHVNPNAVPMTIRKESPSPLRSKPETPPKKDFRANLKTRQVSAGKEPTEDAEFKNVFGKLKRTQTQNYVAPDELKSNILRGKAGLAMTGGPKKTERKDDFKESIQKQKEAIKAGLPPGVSRKISGNSITKEDPPTPEAILKKKGLTRSDSVLSNGSAEAKKTSSKPESIANVECLHDRPQPIPPETNPNAPAHIQKELAVKTKLGNNFNSSLAGLISRGPSPVGSSLKPSQVMNQGVLSEPGTSTTNNNNEDPADGPQLTHMTKARARGPKRRLPKYVTEDATAESPTSATSSELKKQFSENSSPANLFIAKPQLSSLAIEKSKTRALSSKLSNGNRKASQPNTPRKPSTSIASVDKIKTIPPSSPKESLPVNSKRSPVINPKPQTIVNDNQIRKPSAPTPQPLPPTPATPLKAQGPQVSPSRSVSGQETQSDEVREIDRPPPSVRNAAATWDQSPALNSPRPIRAKSPIKLPTRRDEEIALENAGLARKEAKAPIGLGIQTACKEPEGPTTLERNLPSHLPISPKSPPPPAIKPALIANRVVSGSPLPKAKPERLNSPAPQTSEAACLFAEYFNEVPSSSGRVNIDTQSILASRSSSAGSDKIKTLRKQIWEVTGDGKSVAVPSHQEHILFEECMYICTHVFGNAAGTRNTEVYLWCGDGVPTSAAEDAQLFAKKVAKDNNGKLVILQQGKETANFFEALGGIAITRRGSSSRADMPSSAGATYMLCGRRHVSQIAFDEVDFDPQCLCAGFPYIISARFGKLYLWKGSGSSADELGCARLIGMDLGLTGEIEEIDEGKEPSAFWEAFPGGKPKDGLSSSANPKSQKWHLKPSCEKYMTRLFSVDLETPRSKFGSGFSWARRGSAPSSEEGAIPTAQIREINPFTCSDLADDGVFVLDTFFEIYV